MVTLPDVGCSILTVTASWLVVTTRVVVVAVGGGCTLSTPEVTRLHEYNFNQIRCYPVLAEWFL